MSLPLYAQLLAHLLFAYTLFAEPWLGVRAYADLRAAAARGDSGARLRFYRSILIIEWLWVLVIAALAAGLEDPVASLGLGAPGGILGSRFGILFLAGAFAGMAAGAVVVRRDPAFAARQLEPIRDMVPATAAERRVFAAVSVTAGICEELLYRSFLFFYFTEIWALPLAAALVLSSVIFGVAHAYQGIRGIFATGLVGLVFGGLYWASGSVWPGVVLHALMDLRMLAVARALDEAGAPASPRDPAVPEGSAPVSDPADGT